MPSRLALLLMTVALVLAAPAVASADTNAASSSGMDRAQVLNRLLYVQQGSALAEVYGMSSLPLGFTANAGQATLAAEQTQTMQQLHRRTRPLHVYPYVARGVHAYWYIVFTHGKKIVAAANVSPRGKVVGVWTGPQATARFAHGGWSWSMTSWLIFAPASLLFMLAFFDPRRIFRLAHLDGLMVLGFLVSYFLLADQHLYAAVWLAYPPLIYLLVRMLLVGFGSAGSRGRLAPWLSMRVLLIGLPLMIAARIVLSLIGHQEIDVGIESVIGAFRTIHHLPIYYNDPNHGDTYGPITYLAYVPFELVFPWKNSLSNLHAADAAAIFFDLATVVGLMLLGRRLRAGSEGTRLGLILSWAWVACPFTVIGLTVHTNDGLVAMLTVYALLALRSPVLSGGLLGLATAAKFSPAGLLPLLASPRRRGLRGAVSCAVSFALVVGLAVFSWLPPQGLGYFYQRTIGFQINRTDVFSPWALHPGLHPLQIALGLLAVLLALAVAVVPRERSFAQICALAGAVTIAIQLPATHWYYYYIIWFLPFALVAFVGGTVRAPEPASEEPRHEWLIQPADHEPAMAGA